MKRMVRLKRAKIPLSENVKLNFYQKITLSTKEFLSLVTDVPFLDKKYASKVVKA